MIISKFYELINSELISILDINSGDDKTKTHKKIEQNKGYALLIWFLNFYGKKDLYKSYITDGVDDKSCDIIFSNKNTDKEEIFYVVQSKFVNFDIEKNKSINSIKKIDKQEFGATLNDFSMILSGERVNSTNKSFNKKYEELKLHLEQNGKVRFIFFTLAEFNDEITNSIEAFNKKYSPNITLEVIDFEKIRRDYIEFKYKEIQTNNPLEYKYNLEDESIINLDIERFRNEKRDIFEFEGREKAYIVLLKPKTLYELFRKYKFSLFFKNVRNPLHKSNYNPKIVETLLKKPNAFWYFNNGITAITKILPDIGVHAKKIKIEGLQIINGAQTVYSIYQAYENATPSERKSMDNYAKINLRLIGSGDEEFNMQITRYTNFQNPMTERDFWANDDVQQRLQNESFKTDIWYEKRRGEFQLTEEEIKNLGIRIVSNEDFIPSYLAFHLEKPHYSISKQNYFFIREGDGIYNEIFNQNTNFYDMYISYFMFNIIKDINIENNKILIKDLKTFRMVILALSKIALKKFFITKYESKDFNLYNHILNIIKNNRNEDINELKNVFNFTYNFILGKLDHSDIYQFNHRLSNLITSSLKEDIKELFEQEEVKI